MTLKISSEEKLSKAEHKTNKVLVKNFFTQTHLTILNIKKNCISKLSNKIFMKRKTRAGKADGYRMLLSCKSVTFFKKFNFPPDNSIRSSDNTPQRINLCPVKAAPQQINFHEK